MAVRLDLKIKGVEELQRKLLERKEAMTRVLDMKLLQICEEAVTHAKIHKGYKDRTANLKNSISFALFRDGELIEAHEGQIPKPEEVKDGQSSVEKALEEYLQRAEIADNGYTLVIVACMEYGVYVEHKGYNVLYLTKYFVRDELEKVLSETIEEVFGE